MWLNYVSRCVKMGEGVVGMLFVFEVKVAGDVVAIYLQWVFFYLKHD